MNKKREATMKIYMDEHHPDYKYNVRVGRYQIDWKYNNILVECDEGMHSRYTKYKEYSWK